MHREILGLNPGDPREGDHRNQNKLDNRRSNLRIVTHAQNKQNLTSYKGSTSRHLGVSRARKRWRADVAIAGSRRYGWFDTEDEAADAAARWREELMPFSEPQPIGGSE